MSTRKPKSKAEEPEIFPEQGEFEGMETPKIAALDKKGRIYLEFKDKAKQFSDKKKESEGECITIMRQHEITHYDRGGLHLRIKESESLDGSID